MALAIYEVHFRTATHQLCVVTLAQTSDGALANIDKQYIRDKEAYTGVLRHMPEDVIPLNNKRITSQEQR